MGLGCAVMSVGVWYTGSVFCPVSLGVTHKACLANLTPSPGHKPSQIFDPEISMSEMLTPPPSANWYHSYSPQSHYAVEQKLNTLPNKRIR